MAVPPFGAGRASDETPLAPPPPRPA